MSIPAEILKKVKRLEISTRKLVNNVFAGEYHTLFKGQGMTFADFREYVPGDDVRHISWQLTARTGKTHLKRYDEERELSMLLLVDISGSADFGSGQYLKGEVMAHLAAVLAFAALKNKDQVGLVLFSDQVEHYVPPGKGIGHIQRIIRDIYYFKPKSKQTNLSCALKFTYGVMKKRGLVFILSDFIDQDFSQNLKWISKKHDVHALVVEDQFEVSLPQQGILDLFDPESEELISIDTSSPEVRAEWAHHVTQLREQREAEFRKAQVSKLNINCEQDFLMALVQYFKRRNSL